MRPEVEQELIDFLREQRVADVSGTLVKLMNWTQEHARENAVNHEEIKGTLRGHSLRLGALEKNDDRIDTRLEQSGSWQLEAEHAKALAHAMSAVWWKDKTVTIIVGLVMLILGGSASLFLRR